MNFPFGAWNLNLIACWLARVAVNISAAQRTPQARASNEFSGEKAFVRFSLALSSDFHIFSSFSFQLSADCDRAQSDFNHFPLADFEQQSRLLRFRAQNEENPKNHKSIDEHNAVMFLGAGRLFSETTLGNFLFSSGWARLYIMNWRLFSA